MATPIKLPDGSLTERIYWLLREQQYHKVVEALEDLMQRQSYLENPRTFHALLSLLGYCLYTMGAFEGARQVYSQLHQAFPTVVEYELYMAYCVLYSTACEPTAALTTTRQDQDISAADPLISLCIRSGAVPQYDSRLLRATSDEALLDSAALFRVGKFDGGLRIAAAAAHAKMWTPALAYNEALCAYKAGKTEVAARIAERILSLGALNYNGTDTEAARMDMLTFNILMDLQVNAANLRCALDISDNRLHAAKGHLDMLCSRKDEGLDCVTLHNQALTTSSSDPADSISRLECLLAESRCPPTTASNLLILYCNLLRCYEELCKDDINWKINMGHLRFMQELDDKRSVQGWEAGVLANMLAANIILGHLDQAQELLKNSIPYSSAVKLVIGTVYCSEKAYDYGIKTMIEGLLPMEKILNADSWCVAVIQIEATACSCSCSQVMHTDVSIAIQRELMASMKPTILRSSRVFLRLLGQANCQGFRLAPLVNFCECSECFVQGMNVLVDEARAFLRVLLGLAEEGTPSTK
ncbi:tetratricopeptide repeat protein 30 homolog [Cyclospora cayetanensis]|uniref:Tetratricopeptide repeat protein 30 homolog n=1 Tax=Cyclospora cayetanensis TaxID=88456 RepID=A0A6P6RUR9_9EIME|nr:tetratricopeptide repeat protein 30 homolog [Cyclospora cayetanensis]